MNSFLVIRPWSAVITIIPRLARRAWTGLAAARHAKASFAALAMVATVSASAQTPDHYVYLSFLPKASELRQDAQANNLTILSLEEQPGRVIVSYRYPDGHTATLGYALRGTGPLPTTSTPSSFTRIPSSETRVVATPAPEVIYVERPAETRIYYSDPWYNAWAPLTVGFGLGWSTGYYNSGYRGHYHGGGYYRGGYRGGYHGGHGGGHRGGRGR